MILCPEWKFSTFRSKDIGAAALKGEADLWDWLHVQPTQPHPVDSSRARAERAVTGLVEVVLGTEAADIIRLAILTTDTATLG